MKLKLEIINPIDYPGWDDFVMSNQEYSVFHSSAWARVISDSYCYNPLYFTLSDRERILALIPIMEIRSAVTGMRGVSLPFSDYCELIISEESHFTELFNIISNIAEKSRWKYIEFRGGERFFHDIPPFCSYNDHSLNLAQNTESLFSSFRANVRRNINKGIREGVNVQIFRSLQSIKEFYRLHCLTRKYHGFPPQPFYFFKNIYKYIISKDKGIVVAASYNNKIIASAVYFHFNKKAFYKFGASDRTYQHLRANNLVMWHAIKWYSENGYKSFDMGRTSTANKGLTQFKAGWNPQQSKIKYYKYDVKKQCFIIKNSDNTFLYEKLFKYMPIPLLKLIGTLAYRHIG